MKQSGTGQIQNVIIIGAVVGYVVAASCAQQPQSELRKRVAVVAQAVFFGPGQRQTVARTDSYLDTIAHDLKTYFPSCPVVLSQDKATSDYLLTITYEESGERPDIGFFRTTVSRKNGDIAFTSSKYDTLADESLQRALDTICKDAVR